MNHEKPQKEVPLTRLHRRSFFMAFETLVTLAVPAFLVLGTAKIFELGGVAIMIWLAVAFIFSWTIIIYRIREMNK